MGSNSMIAQRIFRMSDREKDGEAVLRAQALAVVAWAKTVLSSNPAPDTFLGRKTQEPFPLPGETEAPSREC